MLLFTKIRIKQPQFIRFIGHLDAQEMMDNNQMVPDNHTEKRVYKLPASLINSWRQQHNQKVFSKFKDTAIVNLKSGDGGDGKISFLRESGRSVGPPDGGDGGDGGHVFIQASTKLSSLAHIRPTYNAANGKPGGSTQLTGKKGENVVLQVPIGTTVRWAPSKVRKQELKSGKVDEVFVDVVTNWSRFDNDASIQLKRNTFGDGGGWHFRNQEEERWMQHPNFKNITERVKKFDMINRRSERTSDMFPFNGLDITDPKQPPIMLLSGGAGGLGNMHFQTPELRSPTFAKKGRFGVEMTLVLELKMLADVGLVGLPNAGKSTLLTKISRANPEVGDYEFTTLVPSVGTINLNIKGDKVTVADIPGIIKDASQNKGLGLGFMRHIERCQGVVFVIGLDRVNVIEDIELLINELGDRIKNKKKLIVANKADVDGSEARYRALNKWAMDKGWAIIPCSAKEGNVHGVIDEIAKLCSHE